MKAAPGTFRPASPSPLAEPMLALHRMMLPRSGSPDSEYVSQQSESEDDTHGDRHFPTTLLHKLRKFPLFKDAPRTFHSKVAAKLKLVQFHPQEYIIKQGDPALSMFWILKGTVRVTSTDGESVYAELEPGAFFGEIGILFNRPRTATVVACQRVLVGVLTADSLNSVLRSYPDIERRIRDEAQERLAMQEKKNKADIPIVQPSRSPVSCMNGPPLQHVVPTYAIPTSTFLLPLSQLVNVSQESISRKQSATLSYNVDQTVSIQESIKTVPMFQHLPQNIIHSIALGVEPISYKPFEHIFRKGQSGSDIYFITQGEVEVIDVCATSNLERVLARLRKGSYFGEMSFLDYVQGKTDPKRSASIRTVSSVELLVIRTDLLKAVCQEYPDVAEELKRTANERKYCNESPDSEKQNPFSIKTPAYDLPSNSPPAFRASSPPISIQAESATNTAQSYRNNSTDVSSPRLLFVNPNWNFGYADSSSSGRYGGSRSVSPVSSPEPDPHFFTKPLRGLKSIEDVGSSRKRKPDDNQLPKGPLDIAAPPRNPSVSPHTFLSALRKQSFHYMPLNKRLKLSNLAGRRRSSVLVSTGSIPDSILLRAFEFLDLPDLMKLRRVSRRWRQLLYVAPKLFRKLDLTRWNTMINDQALISITDFVGSRPTYIDISNCFHVTDEGFSYLVNEVGMSGNITVFKMRCLWEVSAMAIMDLTSPSVGQHLEEVDLSNCRKVQDNVVERLIGWESEAPETTVHLPGPEGSYNNEAGSKNLKVLNVGYCKHLTDNFMYHISMHANERLESLDLTRCTTITDVGFQHWTYRSFPKLKKLSLKDCTFLSDLAIISLANAAPNLEILNLNFCCALLDLAIEALCQGCLNLRELDLSFCGSAVSDSSLVSISLHMARLQKLVVKGCVRVTRAGVDALLSGYSPLTYIDISQCRNAHEYPGRIPAQSLRVNPSTKSAFISIGVAQGIVELVI